MTERGAESNAEVNHLRLSRWSDAFLFIVGWLFMTVLVGAFDSVRPPYITFAKEVVVALFTVTVLAGIIWLEGYR